MPADPIAQAVFDENVRRLQQLGIGDAKYARAFLLGVKCAVLIEARANNMQDTWAAFTIVDRQKQAVAEAERLQRISRPIHPDAA